ncbi:uncharacterized protein LOC111348028 [Spodoptera litura]|uniref:Uncharacterized protein LOC111347970 n=1 Tax=Spodoptera litura TaxID=69820 RepID=A0A9J7DQ26_SPOLT|nr:uncharacterized protein LOC111347970 [Spodoptera litura]XP_022814249.1 uncharacterized protein LOC111348028 [Spodoptera litura]
MMQVPAAAIVILIMCYRSTTCLNQESSIIPIYHSPGIYFEPTTNINFYTDHWKVITHVDLISLEPYLNKIESLLQDTLTLCDKIVPKEDSTCKDMSSPIEVLLQSNSIKLQSLSYIISNQSTNKVKRSLEFGGEILKFFFGTLDADDARKYDAAIESCKKSETEMFHLMRDNIHIVKSTINNFNTTIYKLNQNEIKLNAQINQMNKIFSQITKTDNLLLYTSKLNNLLNIIEGSLLAISNILDTTLNSILFSKVNVLHPSVISPLNLYLELSRHSSQINKRLDFPVSLSIQNIHSIIDVSEFSSYYYNNKVIFILRIPLITPDRFMAYKNIPLPTPHDDSHNTYALIQPSNSYIALSDDRLHYAMLDTLDKCKMINNNLSICELNTIYSCITNPNCESKILTEVTLSLPTECDAKLLYGQIDIWQKLRNNKWIYVQSNTNKLTIKCDENIDDHSITGTGIVKLSPNCIGYSKTIQLIPTSSYSLITKSPLDIRFDITTDDCCKKDIFNKSLPQLSPISLSKINLDSLKYATHQMDNLEQELNNLEKESHFIKYGPYYSTFTYILIVCLILYIAYKLYKCFKSKHSSNGGCCVKIFNQCYNQKSKRKSNFSNSIEMTEVSSSTEEDNKSVQSLPVSYPNYKSTSKVNKVRFSSNRNLNF